MNKCDQCIVRQLSSLKALNKDEVVKLANSKTTYKIKKENPFLKKVKLLMAFFV